MSSRRAIESGGTSLFFSGVLPRVIAHRGLALDVDENTLPAFAAALEAGAQILETDVRATADGVAVLFHDDRLSNGKRVQDLTLAALQSVPLPRGGTITTLQAALTRFPSARFNIDVKSTAAVVPTAKAIRQADAVERVLIASFSRVRQRGTARLLPGVATSGTSMVVLGAVMAGKLGCTAVMRFILRGIDAAQIPTHVAGMLAVSPAMIKRLHSAGVEVHVWTVNSESEMKALRLAGVDGIVTDRCDLACRVFAL